MSQFLYFFENAVGLLPADVARAGCGHVLPTMRKTAVSTGPGGVGGVCAVASGEHIGFYPDKQTWRRLAAGSKVWVGMWTELPKPGPDDLSLGDQQPGHLVKLRDGREWLAPVAREWDAATQVYRPRVPAALDLDESGEWVRGAVEPRFARLWEIASLRWDTLSNPDAVASVSQLCDWAVECLQVNYRIGRVEAAMLGLFDDQALAALSILDASVDWPTIKEWQKKTAAERTAVESSSPDGVAA